MLSRASAISARRTARSRSVRSASPTRASAGSEKTVTSRTKGRRQTGGQGLFRADDNLESIYARAALRQLYLLIYGGKIEGFPLQTFEDATGLRLADNDGSLREDLPPITTFLNRLLALTIDMQNTLFGVFDDLLRTRIEGAIASGTYDVGIETVTAESLRVTDRRTLYVHPASGAETQVFTIARRDRNRPFSLADALDVASDPRARLLVNAQSGRAAVQVPAPSMMLDDGEVERRVRLIRPMEPPAIPLSALTGSHWQESDRADFIRAWETELAAVPASTDSSLHIVTGLLLPIWKWLRNDSMRVYRSRPMMASASSDASSRRPGSPRRLRARLRPSIPRTPSRPCAMGGRSCTSRTGLRFAAPRSWGTSASRSPVSPTAWSTGSRRWDSCPRSSPGNCASSCRSGLTGRQSSAP